MKDYGLHQSFFGFDKQTKMEYFYKIIVYVCAYVFAPYLVQTKWTHC